METFEFHTEKLCPSRKLNEPDNLIRYQNQGYTFLSKLVSATTVYI